MFCLWESWVILNESVTCIVTVVAWKLNLDGRVRMDVMDFVWSQLCSLPSVFHFALKKSSNLQVTLFGFLCQQIMLLSFSVGLVAAAPAATVVTASQRDDGWWWSGGGCRFTGAQDLEVDVQYSHKGGCDGFFPQEIVMGRMIPLSPKYVS